MNRITDKQRINQLEQGIKKVKAYCKADINCMLNKVLEGKNEMIPNKD